MTTGDPQPAPPLILVAGMHRSGTSLAGSILQRLNVELPGTLIAADINNPEGYFERSDATEIQEQLLIALQRWWPSANGIYTLPADWLDSTPALEAAQRLKDIIRAEQRRQNRAWAIKDPRISLLLPLWLNIAMELRCPVRVIHCLRDPAEVVTSLVKRDHAATGMTHWRAQQLWWRHHLELLRQRHSCPQHYLLYDHWFDNRCGQQLQELAQFCTGHRTEEHLLADAMTCIKPAHRRSRPKNIRISSRVRALENTIRQLAEGKADIDAAVSDAWIARQPNVLRHALINLIRRD